MNLNENVFESIELNDDQKALIKIIKMKATILYSHFKCCDFSYPEMSLAIQHLEESVMWATKAISKGNNHAGSEPSCNP